MATLSSFFGSASTGGGGQTTGTMRVFTKTGSMTLPSDTVYAAYGALGGGGTCVGAFDNGCSRRSGGGGGFTFKEGAHTGSATICVVVGDAARYCSNCLSQACSQGGTTYICGFDAGNVCATGGSCYVPGCGAGGDINTCGGCGGSCGCSLGGAGAGGLYGNGGSSNAAPGGGGMGSGGGGGGGGPGARMCCTNSYFVNAGRNCALMNSAEGGGGGQPGQYINGGNGLNGIGGMAATASGCTGYNANVPAMTTQLPTGGYIPQYGRCGYYQSKTYFAAAGGGGASRICLYPNGHYEMNPQSGAPGGGGGGHCQSTCGDAKDPGNGGFGAGAGGTIGISASQSGFGAGAATFCYDTAIMQGGQAGQGVAVVEYWVG